MTPEAMNYSLVRSNGNFSIRVHWYAIMYICMYVCTYIVMVVISKPLNHRLQETLTYIPPRTVKFIDALETKMKLWAPESGG